MPSHHHGHCHTPCDSSHAAQLVNDQGLQNEQPWQPYNFKKPVNKCDKKWFDHSWPQQRLSMSSDLLTDNLEECQVLKTSMAQDVHGELGTGLATESANIAEFPAVIATTATDEPREEVALQCLTVPYNRLLICEVLKPSAFRCHAQFVVVTPCKDSANTLVLHRTPHMRHPNCALLNHLLQRSPVEPLSC